MMTQGFFISKRVKGMFEAHDSQGGMKGGWRKKHMQCAGGRQGSNMRPTVPTAR